MQLDPRLRPFFVLEGERLLVGRRRREMPRVDLFPFEGRPDGRAGIGRALRRPNAVRVLERREARVVERALAVLEHCLAPAPLCAAAAEADANVLPAGIGRERRVASMAYEDAGRRFCEFVGRSSMVFSPAMIGSSHMGSISRAVVGTAAPEGVGRRGTRRHVTSSAVTASRRSLADSFGLAAPRRRLFFGGAAAGATFSGAAAVGAALPRFFFGAAFWVARRRFSLRRRAWARRFSRRLCFSARCF